MNITFVILWMIFFHIVADYNLQGWLATAKQKSWWEKHEECRHCMWKYKHDYIMALIMHSISWTFMVMLPIAYVNNFTVDWLFALIFVVNVVAHAVIDHAKANVKNINLVEDQILHLMQISFTSWLLFV